MKSVLKPTKNIKMKMKYQKLNKFGKVPHLNASNIKKEMKTEALY
jgi:hypothetical protein